MYMYICTHFPTYTHTQESCKENESLLSEFVSIISELSQQFDPVTPDLANLPPLEPEPMPEMQSLESQFEQRSTIVLSATDDTEYALTHHVLFV